MSVLPLQKIINKQWYHKCTRPNPIRKLFEEGIELKKKFGASAVCDFSLGNPVLPPPDYFAKALAEIAQNPPPDVHSYMPNQGKFEARKAFAKVLSRWYNWPLEAKNITITEGAASALTILFHTILNPGDEVIVIVPYFLGYDSYISHPGGKFVCASATADYDIDVSAIEKVITPQTRAILINSPNNPTGKIYSVSSLRTLASLLDRVYASRLSAAAAACKEDDSCTSAFSPILLVSDETYRRISYIDIPPATCGGASAANESGFGGDGLPSVFAIYPYSFVCSSFSKDLSLPGERIGYLVTAPALDSEDLGAAFAGNMRECGFVNGPSIMQFALEKTIDNEVTFLPWYRERRDLLYEGLTKEAGLTCLLPEGAFYLFPKIPAGVTDVEFTDLLRKELVLSVPGSVFGDPSSVRFAYCGSIEDIRNAIPRIKKVVEAIKTANKK